MLIGSDRISWFFIVLFYHHPIFSKGHFFDKYVPSFTYSVYRNSYPQLVNVPIKHLSGFLLKCRLYIFPSLSVYSLVAKKYSYVCNSSTFVRYLRVDFVTLPYEESLKGLRYVMLCYVPPFLKDEVWIGPK
jgi:hypothetical protein